MAHNLNETNGKVAMAYTGETPWHELGTRVDGAMTSAEALEKANLDYKVEKRGIEMNNANTKRSKNSKLKISRMKKMAVVISENIIATTAPSLTNTKRENTKNMTNKDANIILFSFSKFIHPYKFCIIC